MVTKGVVTKGCDSTRCVRMLALLAAVQTQGTRVWLTVAPPAVCMLAPVRVSKKVATKGMTTKGGVYRCADTRHEVRGA